jgi:Protein of unknown function (Porph_ging).
MTLYKHIIFLFFLSFFLFSKAQILEGRVTYLATMKHALEYSKKNKTEEKQIKKGLNKLYKNTKDVKLVLEFNKKQSCYKLIEKLDFANEENFNLTEYMSGGKFEYFTYNNVMKYTNYTLDCALLGDCFLIENDFPKWELKQETKKIGGFLCYKAVLRNPKTSKINLEIWYAPEIPYSYGIMNYYGLPGLILELNKKTISVTAINNRAKPI